MSHIGIWAADPKIIDAFSALLQDDHYTIWGSSSCQKIRSFVESKQLGLLLVDLDRLSDAHSFEDWFQALPQSSQCPRLFVTSRVPFHPDLLFRLSSQNEHILEKPLKRTSFLKAIAESFEAEVKSFINDARTSDRFVSSPELESAVIGEHSNHDLSGLKIGSAVLRDEIGRGGMGVVYKGFQDALERDVAVKMILPKLIHQKDMLVRLQREALSTAKLKSPHIVRIFDAGFTSENIFYIVMEWLPGQDLEVRLHKQGAFSPTDALQVVRQVALGLHTAHKEGMIHRDIKPSNIILSDSGHATLTDFGLVFRKTDARLTNDGMVVGTADYLAPEQITESTLDARTDIYCLGMVLFEMLSGEVPYRSGNVVDVLHCQVEKPIPDLRLSIPNFPEDIWQLLSKMTNKVPSARFRSCEEVLYAIDTVLARLQSVTGGFHSLSHSHHLFRSTDSSKVEQSAEARSSSRNLSASLSTSASYGFSAQLQQMVQVASFRVSMSGSIRDILGELNPLWRESMPLFMAFIQQLESTLALGAWKEALGEADPESLLFGMEDHMIQAGMFRHKDLPTALRMSVSSTHVTPAPATLGSGSPLLALSSAVGVSGLLLFSEEGEPLDVLLSSELEEQTYAQRLAPLAALLSSVPLPLKGLDLMFEEGRVLVWPLPGQFLFVIASHQLNKTLLSLLVWRHREQLSLVRSSVGRFASGSHLLSQSQSLSQSQLSHHPTSKVISQSYEYQVSDSLRMDSIDLPEQIQVDEVLDESERKTIQRAFAEQLGPMAKLMIKKESKKLGFSSKHIPKSKVNHLIKRLSRHLDGSKKNAFLERVGCILPT